jgi:arylsulfatase A-like enzyme
MTKFVARLFLALVILSALSVAWISHEARSRPIPRNVVFIVLDTTRADALGTYGYKRETTPSLDRFAEQSIVFERAYTHVPWTVPSVASMFTSLTPLGHGIVEWGQPLDDDFVTLAEVYQSQGYQTHGIISHHAFRSAHNLQQGFDVFDRSIIRTHDPQKASTATLVSELGLAALDKLTAAEAPFFLWLHYFDPHNTYMPHEGIDFGQTPRDLYDGEILYQDRALGTFFDGLEARGLAQSTVVVVIGDHGEEFEEHGTHYHSGQLYEESVRIPLLIRFPGFEPGRIKGVIGESDVAPTLLTLMGLPIPPEFEGVAVQEDKRLFPLWFDRRLGPTPGRGVYLETFRLLQRRQGIVRGNWKLIHDLKAKKWLLFNLKHDPGEKQNVFNSSKKIRKSLKKELASYTVRERFLISAEELDEETAEILRALGYVK